MSARSFRRRVSAALLTLAVAVTAALVPSGPAQAVPATNYIFNNGSVGIGVWHDAPSASEPIDDYDAVLPAYKTTRGQWGWDHGSGIYIGDNFCAAIYRTSSSSPGSWTLLTSLAGPGRWYTRNYSYHYQVQTRRC